MTRQQIILLILSDANTRERAEHHLRQQGFGVFATGETPIALDWLKRHTPDLVVCDLLLPGTRTAITHVLRHKGEARLPRMIGLVREGLPVSERLRELFGYDDVVSDRMPVAVLTKRLLTGP